MSVIEWRIVMSIQEPASEDLSRYPGFRSFKNEKPIHYPRRWQRDALIQAALDPLVSAMGPLERLDWPPLSEFCFAVSIAGNDFACVIGDARQTRLKTPSLPFLHLSRAALVAEPLFSTARAVWSRKRLTVDPVIRYRVIEMASLEVSGAKAGDIIDSVGETPLEPVDVLLAMLAQGFLAGHLGNGLNSQTKLRSAVAQVRIRCSSALRKN